MKMLSSYTEDPHKRNMNSSDEAYQILRKRGLAAASKKVST